MMVQTVWIMHFLVWTEHARKQPVVNLFARVLRRGLEAGGGRVRRIGWSGTVHMRRVLALHVVCVNLLDRGEGAHKGWPVCCFLHLG